MYEPSLIFLLQIAKYKRLAVFSLHYREPSTFIFTGLAFAGWLPVAGDGVTRGLR